MKRFWQTMILFTLTFSFLNCSISQGAASNDTNNPPTDLTAKGAVLIDMQSHQVLFDQNKDAKLYPASITKIMTALLALEHGDLDAVVTTSQLAREQEGNRIYLETGEKQTMEKLLYGLMLNSGNDAAVAIAEHLGGSVEGFAKMMNDRAAELGAKNTHFVTPNGLHDDNHYTTPYDMTLITEAAMKIPKFREIVATEQMEWHGQEWESLLVNLNSMLWNYDGANGVKTGFTDQAQQTIVVTVKRGERELMAVLMGVQNKQMIRLESTRLLDYGFNATHNERVAKTGDVIVSYPDQEQQVDAVIKQDIYATVHQGSTPQIEKQVHLTQPVAPYPAGSKVGFVDVRVDGQKIATADLFAARDVFPPPTPLEQVTSPNVLAFALPSGAVLLAALLLITRRRRRRALQSDSTYKI